MRPCTTRNFFAKMSAFRICSPSCHLKEIPANIIEWTGGIDKIKCIDCTDYLMKNGFKTCKEMSTKCYENFMDFLEKFDKYGIRLIQIIVIEPSFENDEFYATNYIINDIKEKEAFAVTLYAFENGFTMDDIITFITSYFGIVTFEDIEVEMTEYYYDINNPPEISARFVFVYDLVDREIYIFRERPYKFFRPFKFGISIDVTD